MQKRLVVLLNALVIVIVSYLFMGVGKYVATTAVGSLYVPGVFLWDALFAGLASGYLTARMFKARGIIVSMILAVIPVAFSWFVAGSEIVRYAYVFKHGEPVPVPGHQGDVMYSVLFSKLAVAAAGSILAYLVSRRMARRSPVQS